MFKMKDEEKNKLIGMRIRSIRKKKGWIIKDLANKVNKKIGTISDIERGRGNFSLKTLQDIADALGVHLYELTGEKPREVNKDNYIEKGNLADLIKLVNTVKEQPTLYLDGKEISKETRVFVEDFLDMIVERELKKHKKKTPKKEPK